MQVLERIWSDLRSGENVDLYVTVVVAVGLAALNVVGVAPQRYLAPITLAVLGLLAITSLGNRYRIEELLEGKSWSVNDYYMDEYPPTYREGLEAAEQLWLVGVSLRRTIHANYTLLEQKVHQGHEIRILLVHPEGPAIEMAVARNYAGREVKPKSSEIQFNLQLLCRLQKIPNSRVEVRTIQHPLAYGVTAVDPDRASGVLYLEHYPFRTASDSMPRFALRASDGRWYDFFRSEMSSLWDAGIEWPCGD